MEWQNGNKNKISIARSCDDPVYIRVLLLLTISDPSIEETTRDTSCLSWTKLLLGMCLEDYFFVCDLISPISPMIWTDPSPPTLYHCSSLFDNLISNTEATSKSKVVFPISCAGLNFFFQLVSLCIFQFHNQLYKHSWSTCCESMG